MTFSPSGDHFFAVLAGQNRGLLWAVPSWQETKASSSECNYFSVPAVFSHDGKFLACQDGPMLRIWNVTTSPAALVNSVPTYRPDADDPSWNRVFWANDGTLLTRNPQGGFQFLSQDKVKGAILTANVGSGKQGLLQLGHRQFVGDNLTPGTLQITDVVVAPNGLAFGALNGKREKKPGFFIWLIPSAKPVPFLAFDLPGEPDSWECRGVMISQDGAQLAASLYYPGTRLPPMPKTWMVSICAARRPRGSICRRMRPTCRFPLSGFFARWPPGGHQWSNVRSDSRGEDPQAICRGLGRPKRRETVAVRQRLYQGSVFHEGRTHFSDGRRGHVGGRGSHNGQWRIFGPTRPHGAADRGFLGRGNGTAAMPVQRHRDSRDGRIARWNYSCDCLLSIRKGHSVGERSWNGCCSCFRRRNGNRVGRPSLH